jgi:hypothetical protein
MGQKHPDVIRMPPAPTLGLTLAQMHLQGWTLRGFCRRCGLQVRVSLPALIMVNGPDAIWWGKDAPCPGWECSGGRLAYSARAINGGSWVNVSTTRAPREVVETWKATLNRPDLGPR